MTWIYDKNWLSNHKTQKYDCSLGWELAKFKKFMIFSSHWVMFRQNWSCYSYNTSATILNRIVGFLNRVQAQRILILCFCFFFIDNKAHDKDVRTLSKFNHETSYTIIGCWLFQKFPLKWSRKTKILNRII